MKILCFFFGHVPAYGYGNVPGNGYFTVARGPIDGSGREHCDLYCRCERCDIEYRVGKIHLPKDKAKL